MEVKLKLIKELVKAGIAIDVTEKENFIKEGTWQVIAYSRGIYGINGCLIATKTKLYAITKRSSNLFYYL